MRRVSKRREKRNAEAKPIRERLIKHAGKCEICGHSPSFPHAGMPVELSYLCCHEIASGPLRDAALDKPYAILVLCWRCNQYEVEDRKRWPESRQLSVLQSVRPEDYDLIAYNHLVNPNAPNRIEQHEVEQWHTTHHEA